MPGRFCERCGSPLGPEARFCGGCGAVAASTSVAPPPAPPDYAPPPPPPAPPAYTPPPAPPPASAAPAYAPVIPPPPAPVAWTRPAARPRRGKAVLVIVALVIVALVGAAAADAGLFDGTPGGTPAPGQVAGPGSTATPGTPGDEEGLAPVGEPPAIERGPSLGEAWTTAPDPATFILIDEETRVASDQYLVVFEDDAPVSRAEAAAAAIDGTIIGRIEYLDTWKIGAAATMDSETWYARKAILEQQPGVVVVAPVGLVVTQAAPDCAPALGDKVYTGANAKPYEMVGVRAAWEAYYASGLPKSSVHLGIIDTELTKGDAKRKLNWEFDDVTFSGDPRTTKDLRPATKTDPRKDGFHHADGTLGIIAADGGDGGIAGIASPLGSSLVVSHSVLGAGADEGAPAAWVSDDGLSYTDAELLNTMRQIESGATIINGSWGSSTVSSANAGDAAMWRMFYAKMAKDHPDVLFVFAAGNYNTALDGRNYYPGGIPAPNVITVGNVNTSGTRNSSSNGVGAGVTGGEVTLGAPGHQAVWGKGADGKVRAEYGGTSSAAPMVAATAVLMRAIDPSLTAAEIKDLIAGSADVGALEVGGKALRADLAVRKAIDRARAKAKLPPLTDAMIAAGTQYCEINVTAGFLKQLAKPAGSSEWAVRSSLRNAAGPTTLTLVVGGARPADWRKPVTGSGQAVAWTIGVPKAGVPVIVTRLDNGFWVKVWVRETKATPKPSARPTATPKPKP